MAANTLFTCLLVATCAAAVLQASKADDKNLAVKSDEPVDEPRCPRPADIEPCTCNHDYNAMNLKCSGSQVTQASIDNAILKSRSANNLQSEETLKLGEMQISKTSLTAVNLTSLFYTELNNVYLLDNQNLKSITGPMTGWDCDDSNSKTTGKIQSTFLQIDECKSLNDDGFGNTLKMFDMTSLKYLYIPDTNIMGGKYPLNDGSGDVEFLPGLSAFKNLEMLQIGHKAITEVSGGQFKRNRNLVFLDIGYSKLTTIGDGAFALDDGAYSFLTITMIRSSLTDASFREVYTNGLTYSRRSINLLLSDNQITTLSEANFRPFLEKNSNNKMTLSGNRLQCDSKMRWLRANKKVYEKQVLNATCANDNNRSIFESKKTL